MFQRICFSSGLVPHDSVPCEYLGWWEETCRQENADEVYSSLARTKLCPEYDLVTENVGAGTKISKIHNLQSQQRHERVEQEGLAQSYKEWKILVENFREMQERQKVLKEMMGTLQSKGNEDEN
ncbi:hypothetical protein RvY_17534 [Ramazzottius varieornatus]|uniref:Uncharacterized protein n=1 Tax=Ramazzottius varieornatus TaxID=947166 RepID=A0A1D1W2H1_RAMVA|nr:hypothetical protein RvY_17534 [Ramazzottius varieornatus]